MFLRGGTLALNVLHFDRGEQIQLPIRYNDYTGSSSISTKGESRLSSSINDESGESLVDTTLSILKMLLSFIIFFFLVGRGNSRIVQLAEIHSNFELFCFLFF